RPPTPILFPYTTLFRSLGARRPSAVDRLRRQALRRHVHDRTQLAAPHGVAGTGGHSADRPSSVGPARACRARPSRIFEQYFKSEDRKSTRLNSSHLGIS